MAIGCPSDALRPPPLQRGVPEGTPVVPVRDLPSRPRRNRKSETVRRAFSETFLHPGERSLPPAAAGSVLEPGPARPAQRPATGSQCVAAACRRRLTLSLPPSTLRPPANFILPVFVHDGEDNIPIDSLPGVACLGWKTGLLEAVGEARSVGVNQVRARTARRVVARRGSTGRALVLLLRWLLQPHSHPPPPTQVVIFPKTPEHLKTLTAEEAFNPDGLAQRTIALLKDKYPDLEVRGGLQGGQRQRQRVGIEAEGRGQRVKVRGCSAHVRSWAPPPPGWLAACLQVGPCNPPPSPSRPTLPCSAGPCCPTPNTHMHTHAPTPHPAGVH